MKKYELIAEKKIDFFGRTLFKIRALIDIGDDVEAGEEGGYIEAEENLSHDGDAWVYGNAQVYGDARVSGNAQVYGSAWVYGNAQVYGDARVSGNAQVYGSARVYGNARVSGNARVDQNYKVMMISNMGRIQRTTTFFACEDGTIHVNCGCFSGTLNKFRAQVRKTHGENKHAQAYLAAADFVESVLETEGEHENT